MPLWSSARPSPVDPDGLRHEAHVVGVHDVVNEAGGGGGTVGEGPGAASGAGVRGVEGAGKGQRAEGSAAIDVLVPIADDAARYRESAHAGHGLRRIQIMLAENKGSAGSGGDGGQVLLFRQSAAVQGLVTLHQIDFGRTDQGHGQVDCPQGIVKTQTAGAVVADVVGAGAAGGEEGVAFGEIVGRAGDISVAVGGKHTGFAIGHAAEVGGEIKPLDLIDVLPIETGLGKIPFGNEARHAIAVVSTSCTKKKRE